MELNKNGIKTINNKKYNYKIFDTAKLITIIQNNNKFTNLLENTIKEYRKYPDFKINDLLNEYYSNFTVVYFIIYNKEIKLHQSLIPKAISTCRFYYNLRKKSGYFNMIFTSPKFRGQKICQKNIAFIIKLTKNYINKYELIVDSDNIAAIKCYENNGFKFVKKMEINDTSANLAVHYLMRLKI